MTRGGVPPLAILGGTPRFPGLLHVGRPNIGDRKRLFERLDEALDRAVLSNGGPLVEEFEARLREMTGARHALAVCNATVGLDIAVRAAGLRGEVIVPSFTFVATAHALRWAGLTPVFCDIDPESLTIDPDGAERLIGPTTTGILGVHLWGRTCDTERLDAVAARHGLTVLYDAAHALGCSRRGRMVGNFGRAEVFSFHATKFVNSFEGGAIVTNDDALAGRASEMRNFGIVDWDRTAGLGTNAKMHEASAAMGLTSLDAMPAFVARNLENAEGYARGLAGIPGLRFLSHDRSESVNAQHAVVRVDRDEAALTRDDLVAVLVAERVMARRYFFPGCHRLEPYRSESTRRALPHTERLGDEALSLPTGTAVGAEEVAAICELLRTALALAPEVRSALRRIS